MKLRGNFDKIAAITIGLGCIVMGIQIVTPPHIIILHKEGRELDFSGPGVFFGWLVIVFACSLIITALIRKRERLICSKCENLIDRWVFIGSLSRNKSYRCPKCGFELEDFEGFYIRHPEKM